MDTHCQMAMRSGIGERQHFGAVSSFLGKRRKKKKGGGGKGGKKKGGGGGVNCKKNLKR